MNTHVHRKFNRNINKFLTDNAVKSLLVAISGGQDSLCLIKLLEDFRRCYCGLLKITYIYIDHQWKKDSHKQIKHLINIIKNYKSAIIIYQLKHIAKSELEARKSRYKIIIRHANLYNYSTIVTGHTKTDKIETFWQQIFKGTNLDGITSLNSLRKLSRNVYIYRPLLKFNRLEIHWICRKFHLPIWSDITNYEYGITRNRLRNELIPYISKYLTQNLENKLCKFIHVSHLDNEYIKQNAIKLYLISRHDTNVALNYELIRQQHRALQVKTLQIFFFIILMCA
uniref:tRNA(Ile)-lysidine synthase, chloroplastic n=1 Tax=Caulacanthus okamurae TaxID=152008 RepID=A0A6H1U8I5_9FLOR|nr:tRNA(Ile)-lysidine synthase [Caulacanthus okamurae]QIZ74756.1 tRNA(Ile)-lysidine synthase [Caulacanthus okamurae]